jgi:succinyldiaminopimelate transaminase
VTRKADPPAGFVPPAYPYDRLDEARKAAATHAGGIVDLSVGTPADPPPDIVLAALAGDSGDGDRSARGYPMSAGSVALREAIRHWTATKFGVRVALDEVAVCVGTKEFVASTPQWLKLRSPGRDTVLYPAVAYPTYEMGATLAGLRAVAVPVDSNWRMDLGAIDASDAGRALMLWVNSPGNPAGGLEDLAAAAKWGLHHGVPVFSDECYAEFTWEGPALTVLGHGGGPGGLEGVVAVHSLSKRSNMAGMRVGWYSGDPDIVGYLREVRKHAGLMVPGPVQRAAAVALGDQEHVDAQRALYRDRLQRFAAIVGALGAEAELPAGGFYLWVRAPSGDDWDWTMWWAERAGVLTSPGSFYGEAAASHVRFAMVAPMPRLDLAASRLGVGPAPAVG